MGDNNQGSLTKPRLTENRAGEHCLLGELLSKGPYCVTLNERRVMEVKTATCGAEDEQLLYNRDFKLVRQSIHQG